MDYLVAVRNCFKSDIVLWVGLWVLVVLVVLVDVDVEAFLLMMIMLQQLILLVLEGWWCSEALCGL